MMRGLAKLVVTCLALLSLFGLKANGLRGALVRSGRSLNSWHEGSDAGTVPSRVALVYALHARQQQSAFPASNMDSNAFMRSGRSLFDAGAESSSILRAQRGILQQEQPLVVIDADDGQLMRYGRR